MSSLATSGLRSLLAGFTQDTRLLQLTTALGADALLAESVHGQEGVDQSFRFEIDALSLDAGIALKRLVGQPALLQLRTTGRQARPFHGYITAARMCGANGGLARYRLRLEPWTAFLGIGRDSRAFHDLTVCEIVDAVFSSWRGKGRIDPAWRFDLLDSSAYPKRSLATQYQESDLAFVLRLLNEEGLFCYFEHRDAPDEAAFGSHTLVIADHDHTFKPGAQADIDFRRPGAVMSEDSLDCWWIRWREQAGSVELASWDYRSCVARPVMAADGAGGPHGPTIREAVGQYAWSTPEHGERIAWNELLALNARRERHTGAGTVRTVSPGTTFRVHGNDELDAADDAGRTFVALGVAHLMHNNFNAEIREAVRDRLEPGPLSQLIEQELGGALHAPSRRPGERPLYRMRVDAMRSALPYRQGRFDEHGQPRYPKPHVGGQQTAIVVGPTGSVVHTDRDHRIKVQFHWQRGECSHSRLAHPNPDGHAGAPADDTAGTWVRVATPLGAIAGANWGSNAVPRVGQEVLVDFMDGDIDRPVVIACLYNGRGETDAQHNQARYGAGTATGNAPPWFPGAAGAHAHPAVLSGVKTQAMADSGTGTGAYSQLVFDASAGQPRVSLQRHADAHDGTDELNLGALRHQVDNQRLEPVGFGAELKSAHSLAVRAGQGLLLSTHRNGADAGMMKSDDARSQIDLARQLAQKLSDTANQHGASKNAKLPAIEQLAHSAKAIASDTSATPGTAYAEPHLQLSAPAGIAALTRCSAVISAGNTSSVTAGHDINIVAQGAVGHAATAGISLFTCGTSSAADHAVQETGVRLHAASGKVSVQAQSNAVRLTAERAISVASVTKEVRISAPQHVLLTAAGGGIRLEGGNITLQCPGSIEFKAGSKELAGPQSASAQQHTMPKPGTIAACPGRTDSASADGAAAL